MAKLNNSLLGFPIPEKIVGEVDAAMKGIPKDIREHFKTTVTGADGNKTAIEGYGRATVGNKQMEIVDGERCDVSVITSDSVDRDGEVVLASGLDFSQFQRNPVVTLCHNYQTLPIGKCLWVKKTPMAAGGDCWKAKTQYMPRPDTKSEGEEWIPDTVWAFVRDGYMPGKSIGFIPMSFRDVTPDDIRANPDYADAWGIIDKAMILEYAVCPVQANPDALVEAVGKMRAKGIVCKALVDAMGMVIPDAVAKAVESVTDYAMNVYSSPPPEIIPTISDDVIRAHVERQAKSIIDGMDLSKTIADAFKSRLDDELARAMGRV